MVVGYDCPACGFKDDCDVTQAGQRICPDCQSNVRGITSTDAGHPTDGPETFRVTIGYGGETIRVNAHTYKGAYTAAQSHVESDEHISDISRTRRGN